MKQNINKYLFQKDLIFSYNEDDQKLSIYSSSNDKLLILDGALGLLVHSMDNTTSIDFDEIIEHLTVLCPNSGAEEINSCVLDLCENMVENDIVSK